MTVAIVGTVYDVSWVNDSPYVWLTARQPPREQSGFFLLDTGADVSAIDSTWAASLLGPTGDKAVVAEFDFGITQKDVHFLVQDLSHLRPINGQPQVGTLGTDFLCKFALDLTLGAPRFRLVPKHDREACMPWWSTLRQVPLRDYTDTPPAGGLGNIPTVELNLLGLRLPCQLDTGTSSGGSETAVSINPAAFERIRESLVLVEERTITRTTDETRVQVYEARVPGGLQVSTAGEPLKIERVVGQGPENGHPFTRTEPYALAGMSLIRQWSRVVVDPFGPCLWVGGI